MQFIHLFYHLLCLLEGIQGKWSLIHLLHKAKLQGQWIGKWNLLFNFFKRFLINLLQFLRTYVPAFVTETF
jgi:hypothetical protein